MFIKYKLKFIDSKRGVGPESQALDNGHFIHGKFYHSDAKGWIVGQSSELDVSNYFDFEMQEISSAQVNELARESGTGAFINDEGDIQLPNPVELD